MDMPLMKMVEGEGQAGQGQDGRGRGGAVRARGGTSLAPVTAHNSVFGFVVCCLPGV